MMHPEAGWGVPHHVVWNWEHPTQQDICQRPSVSHGEKRGLSRGSIFPALGRNTWCSKTSLYIRDGVEMVSLWLLR